MAGIPVHRVGDDRYCSALTVQQGNDDVYAGNQLIAVYDDPNSHGAGNLRPPNRRVYIHGKLIVCKDDEAICDNAIHCPTAVNAKGHITTVLVG